MVTCYKVVLPNAAKWNWEVAQKGFSRPPRLNKNKNKNKNNNKNNNNNNNYYYYYYYYNNNNNNGNNDNAPIELFLFLHEGSLMILRVKFQQLETKSYTSSYINHISYTFIYIYHLCFYHATTCLGVVKIPTIPDRSEHHHPNPSPKIRTSNLKQARARLANKRHLPLVFVVAPFVRVDCTDRAMAQLICCYNSPCHTPLENFHGWLLNRKKFARKNTSKSRKSSEKNMEKPTRDFGAANRRSIFQGGSDGDRTGPTGEPFHFREAMCVDSDDFENILGEKNSITTWDSKIIHGIPSNKFLGKTKSTCCYALVGANTTTSPFFVGWCNRQISEPYSESAPEKKKKHAVGVLSWEFLAISQLIINSTSRCCFHRWKASIQTVKCQTT